MYRSPHQAAPPGFIGGRPAPVLEWHSHRRLGYWVHEGAHPAFKTSIWFGYAADIDQWYVTWSGIPPLTWLFGRRRDAELAVVELQMCREGDWQVLQDPRQDDGDGVAGGEAGGDVGSTTC